MFNQVVLISVLLVPLSMGLSHPDFTPRDTHATLSAWTETVSHEHQEYTHRSEVTEQLKQQVAKHMKTSAALQHLQQADLELISSNARFEFQDYAKQPLKGNKCEDCTDFARIAEEIAHNTTDRTEAKKLIGDACHAFFAKKKDKDLEALCQYIPDIALHLLSYGDTCHANVPNVLCADFLNLCLQPCCNTSFTPEQVHLSFATSEAIGDNNSYRVGWTTLKWAGLAQVRWRPLGSQAWSTPNNGTFRTYDIGRWIGVINFAVMTGLQSNTTYEYQVGTYNTTWSKTFNFTTLPLNAGTAERPLRIFGVADMGFGANGHATIESMKRLVREKKIDFVMHPGDVGYADADQVWWDEFFREMEPVMSTVPYMTGPGNHECIWWNCTAYKRRFWMPPALDGAPSDAMWYTLKAGPVSFVMMDSETWFDTPNFGPAQIQWADEQFKSLAASKDRMIFALHHRPLYCSSYSIHDCTRYAVIMRGQIEQLYLKHGISAVMCGHVHNYERTLPVYNLTVMSTNYSNPPAPTYFVNGGAGNREGQAKYYTLNNTWSAFRSQDLSFMLYEFTWETGSNKKNIRLDSKLMHSTTGDVLDKIVLTKEN